MSENELSRIVFDCALKVHQTLGPGLLESAYEECLFFELKRLGFIFDTIGRSICAQLKPIILF